MAKDFVALIQKITSRPQIGKAMLAPHASIAVYIVLLFPVLLPAAEPARVQQTSESQAIERTIEQFFTSMSKRDATGIQAVLDSHLLAIEAGGRQGRLEIVDPSDPKELLPPEGNDDFENIAIDDVKAETSTSYPTIAMASYTLVRPLDTKTLALYENGLKEQSDRLSDVQKKALAQIVENRAHRDQMFAMLVRQHGNWKIACMTFPK